MNGVQIYFKKLIKIKMVIFHFMNTMLYLKKNNIELNSWIQSVHFLQICNFKTQIIVFLLAHLKNYLEVEK